jgi:branched-chain amino acid transport system permease protein
LKLIGQRLHKNRVSFGPYIGVGLVLIILPLFLSPYLLYLAAKILIFAIFAMGLNLILGYTGLVSMGHAAFFGTAVYVGAFLTVHYGVGSFWLVALLGILAAVFMAALFGLFIVHLSGAYFLLITLGLSQLLFSIVWKWRALTGGDDGLPGIPRPDLGLPLSMGDDTYFYYFVFLIFVGCFLLLYRLTDSPFGHALVGIRENESRMKILGYNPWKYKYVSFIIGGGFGGVAGVLYAYLIGIAYPGDIGLMASVMVLFMVILGSPGTLACPLIGATLLTTMEYVVSTFTPERWPLILGAVFVLVSMYFRGGIGIYLMRYWRKLELRHGSPKS